MALYDNPLWVLSHIRNSFVVSDDTGNCELVMGGDKFSESLAKMAKIQAMTPYLNLDSTSAADAEEEEFAPRSLEIRAGNYSVGYRPRCNTEMKLEKMKRDRKNEPNLKTVCWRAPSTELSQEDLDRMFPRKDVSTENKRQVIVKEVEVRARTRSLLSELLEKAPPSESNIFSNFSHISGETDEDGKTIRIYLSMGQRSDSNALPYINIRVKADAKVYDVIGYVCYVYTDQRREPSLNTSVDMYSLYLFDDGEVDVDLPALEAHEQISRYGFNDLALVEVASRKSSNLYDIKVTLPDGTFNVVQIPSRNITMQELMDKAMAKRRKSGQIEKYRFTYNIEARDAPGVALDPTSLLSGVTDTSEFYIVRVNSRRFDDHYKPDDAGNSIDDHGGRGLLTSVEMSAYKEFQHMRLITRLRTRIPVTVAISEDKLEILPAIHHSLRGHAVGGSVGGGFSMAAASSLQHVINVGSQQSRTIPIESVVACSSIEKNDSTLVSIVYRGENGFTKLKLECASQETQTAREICAKLKYLISENSMTSSEVHMEYKNFLERKTLRRRTIHF